MDFEGYTNRRVLIVDDQKEIHDDFAEMLNPRSLASPGNELASAFLAEDEPFLLPDFEMLHARNGEDACGIVSAGRQEDRPVAVAYVDIRMPPGIDGIETIGRIREIDPDIEVVIMTAYTDRPLPEIVQTVGPLHKVLYVRKPFAREEIQQITLSLVGKWNVERKLAESRRQLSIGYTRLESVLNASREPMALYDRDGRLVFANQGYQTLAGLTTSELKELAPDAVTALMKERFHEPELPELERQSIFGDVGDLLEQKGDDEAAASRLFYRATSQVRDSQGTVVGDLYVYRDVSGEMERERMKAELLWLRTELDAAESVEGMVGASRPMQQVYALMRQAAGSDITVLIRGESGTGKELVARMLHSSSPRNKGPFVALNCAAIPESLMESELFGHEQGAFTGATQTRIGAFERANRGTILLDEIGDMQPALQAKLLRVLQEREIQRVGGSGTIPVDVRVIVATNKNLEVAVKDGDFREDLLYRIAAFPIVIPPLRERRGDITMLADYFLRIHAQRSGHALKGISTAACRLLLQYDWPGNVRELNNAIERAVLLEQTDVLQAESLPQQLFQRRAGSERRRPQVAALSLVEVEREALTQALEATGNNITQAARTLGINRVTLHRKLKRYGLTNRN